MQDKRHRFSVRKAMLIALAACVGLVLALPGLLLNLRLLRPFSMPTGSMTRTISPGDRVIMERISFLIRSPRRGDIVVYRADGISDLPTGHFYTKRIAGVPGDYLRISAGILFANDVDVAFTNQYGDRIVYGSIHPTEFLSTSNDVVLVPARNVFLLGDNSTNSLDSRYWGFLTQKNIMGRVVFCYWPADRIGLVK
jgi:signal peptidase I